MNKLPQVELVQIGVRLPAATVTEIKVFCARHGIRIKDFLTSAAIEKLVKEQA